MAETSTIFGFMKYVSATDILSDFKKTVDSHFVNSLSRFYKKPTYLIGFLWLYTSYIKTAAATLAFNEVILPTIGRYTI